MLRFADREHRYTDRVMGPTIVARARSLPPVRFAGAAARRGHGVPATDVVEAGGACLLRGPVQLRPGARSAVGGHSWDVSRYRAARERRGQLLRACGDARHVLRRIDMGISNVGVIGLGYIGLPTAAILAVERRRGDRRRREPRDRRRGEPRRGAVRGAGPGGYVRRARRRRQAARDRWHPEPADAFIVAVPTPFKGDHEPDLSYIKAAAEALAPALRGGELVILESTSPPGTTQRMADWILDARPDLSLDGSDGRPAVHFAHCPERVLPGQVMVELVTNDRIVGGLTPEAARAARDLYQVFCQGEILLTDAVTAEMAKLVENSFRDVNIAFANELSLIARPARHRRVGAHPAGQPPPAREHPAARAGRGRALHRRGPVVHRRRRARGGAPDPDGARGERRQAALGAAQGARRRARGSGPRSSPPTGWRSSRTSTTCASRRPSRSCGSWRWRSRTRTCWPWSRTSTSCRPARRAANVRLVDASEALASADAHVLLVDHAAFRGLTGELPGPAADRYARDDCRAACLTRTRPEASRITKGSRRS